jgi:hypothetical protein
VSGNRRTGHRWTLVAMMVMAAVGGCDDLSMDLERPPQRPLRAPAAPIGAGAQSAKSGRESHATAVEAPVEVVPCCHQVVLLNEPAPDECPPGLHYVRVERASAEQVGCLLSWLYVPSGPAGTTSRYCLVYPSASEAEAAARLASQLDVPPAKDNENSPPPAGGAQAMTLGIGLLYGRTPGQPLSTQCVRRAEAALAQASADPNLPPVRRWAAGMIAGKAAADCLCDSAAAQRHFAGALTQATPGSLEQMAAWLAQACAYIQGGEPRSARVVLGHILEQTGNLQQTELFDRARRATCELDRDR